MTKLKFMLIAFMLTISGLFADSGEAEKSAKNIAELLTKVIGTTPAQWRITWTGDASTQAIISWTTAEQGSSHTIYYDTKSHGLDVSKYQFKQACQSNGEYTSGGYHYHHATISNLTPSTRYYFVLKSDDTPSKQLYFITAPKTGTGYSLIYGGDSRTGALARCQMNMMIGDMIGKDPSILGFIHGGDYVKRGNSHREWYTWMSQHELTTGSDGRVIPIITARGNHDSGPLYKEIFNVGKDQPDWHTVTLGKDVALVILDTNVPGGGDQVTWLEAELKRFRPQTTWLLAQYHTPLFPAVKNVKTYTGIFAPIFEKYNLDLACESDGHCIKRTVPIRDGKEDPTGVTYIGEGGLGVGQRTPETDRWYLQGGMSGSGHHLMRLDMTDDTLRIRTILLGGAVFDDHSLKVRK